MNILVSLTNCIGLLGVDCQVATLEIVHTLGFQDGPNVRVRNFFILQITQWSKEMDLRGAAVHSFITTSHKGQKERSFFFVCLSNNKN